MQTSPSPDRTRDDANVLPRVFLASTVANVPMLGLLLVPQLMRSRAGSETLLMFGATLYLVLIAVALRMTPLVTAWAAPKGESWSPGRVNATMRAIWRDRPRAFWQRVGEWCALFAAAQAAGLLVAWLVPYIEDNPRFGAAGEPRWVLHYGSYVLQAVTIYLGSCLAFAWLGTRLRAMAPLASR
jgi:hypothetical protein